VFLVQKGMLLAFPDVELPPFQRIAPHLATALKHDWGQEIIYLFYSSVRPGIAREPRHYVAQALHCHHARAGSNWVRVASLDASAFEDGEEYNTLIACLARLGRETALGSGPFERLGWFPEVTAWIDQSIGPFGVHLTGAFHQLNASATFSLIRFETDGPAVWFKAVGEPNLHELHVSRHLARFYPDFVPKVLAVREEWNAWLTVEVQGTHLDENSDLSEWTAVAKTLANLQILSMGDTLHLIEVGCKDVRVNALVDCVDPLLDKMAHLMGQQTKQLPVPLSCKELSVLRTQLRVLLSAYSNLDIPNTLGHLDFNPGNIITSRDHCLFLDWADGCVGPPFPTFEYLLERLRRFRPSDESLKRRLLSEYSEIWGSFLGPRELTEALALTPLLAVFTFAVAQNIWHDPDLLREPNTVKLLRSLGRHMKLKADHMSARRLNSATSPLEVV